MSRRLVFVIGAGFALSGCCLGSGCYIEPPSGALTRLGEFGPIPGRNSVKSAKARQKSEALASDDASPTEADLATLKPYSEQWWSVRDAIDRADALQLAKELLISRARVPS